MVQAIIALDQKRSSKTLRCSSFTTSEAREEPIAGRFN